MTQNILESYLLYINTCIKGVGIYETRLTADGQLISYDVIDLGQNWIS